MGRQFINAGEADAKAQECLIKWASLKGHDRCWWHPEFIRPLADIYDLSLEGVVLTPETREIFEEGCARFRAEQYSHIKSEKFTGSEIPRECLANWIENQRGNSYTYHDSILANLAILLDVPLLSQPSVSEEELKEGCTRFQLSQCKQS